MKKISILVPTYNEEDNIGLMIMSLQNLFQNDLKNYEYEIIIIDNDSIDNTRNIITAACEDDKNVKAIFNEKNFGWLRSPGYGLLQTSGDCSIIMAADFQDPIDLLPIFVKEWENGYKVVVGQKTQSEENPIMWKVRSLYYKIVRKFSETNQLEQFTGFGLYDKSFVDILRKLEDPIPFLKGYVAEFIGHPKIIKYNQPKRKRGKSWGSFFRLYDVAMVGITSYTKIGLRFATFVGFLTSALSFFVGGIYFIYKLTHWYTFTIGMAPLIVGIFFIGGVQLFFMGMMGEYILSINERIRNRPLVVEKERINFD